MNVSSRKGNLRHMGLMHGMQNHDALLNQNYRGRREAVSSNNNKRRQPRSAEQRQEVPQLRRQRRRKLHAVACARVHECKLRRVQKLATETASLALHRRIAHHVIATAAVQGIADDRVADVRQVNANLMCASGLDLHAQQSEFGITLGYFKDRMCRAPGSAAQHGHARAVVWAASQARFDLTARLGNATVSERDVELEDLAVAELLG